MEYDYLHVCHNALVSLDWAAIGECLHWKGRTYLLFLLVFSSWKYQCFANFVTFFIRQNSKSSFGWDENSCSVLRVDQLHWKRFWFLIIHSFSQTWQSFLSSALARRMIDDHLCFGKLGRCCRHLPHGGRWGARQQGKDQDLERKILVNFFYKDQDLEQKWLVLNLLARIRIWKKH